MSVRSYEDTSSEQPSSVVRAVRVLRERWWVVALTAAVCMAAALIVALAQSKEYEASSELLFRTPRFGPEETTPFVPSDEPGRESSTNVQIVTSTPVAAAVKERLNREAAEERRPDLRVTESTDDLLEQVTVETEENADIGRVTVRDEDPERAAALANAFAQEFVNYRRTVNTNKVREAQQLVRERIRSLPEGSAERDELEAALQRLIVLEALQTGDAEVVDRATVPESAASPRPRRDAVLALIFGLALGLAIASLLDLLDRRLKTVEDFEEAFGLPGLTAVPQRAFEARTPEERMAALEPYRILRNAIEFRALSDDAGGQVILVSSAMPREGKTSVAINLARALAVGGQRVVLVEADLRRPGFREHFQLPPNAGGLTNVLVGRKSVRGLLRRSGAPGLGDLMILPSGPLPPNSAELLRSRAMNDALDELRGMADYVLLDTPPLLPVADTRVLLDHANIDVFLMVARAYLTTRQDARRCRALFEQHRRRPLGLVVCGLRDDRAYAAYAGPDGYLSQAEPARVGAGRSAADREAGSTAR